MNFLLKNIKSKLFFSTFLSGLILTSIFFIVFTNLVRARFIDYDDISKRLENQKQQQLLRTDRNRIINPRVVIQKGGKNQAGLDFRCLTWSTYPVASQWKQDSRDSDFVIDYYLPPNKKAIICTTPLFATALAQDIEKPFVYEVYPTEYGLQVRIILGVSDIQKACNRFTGNINCVNWILKQQTTLRYEPDV
ncbi:MAG: hypothetical protein ACFB02_01725 [Mastigocoleus sp.]